MNNVQRRRVASAAMVACLATVAASAGYGAVSENLLKNPSFEGGLGRSGVPVGWDPYGKPSERLHVSLTDVAHDGKAALLIDDEDPAREIGVSQSVTIAPDLAYEVSAMVRLVPGERTAGGALLQLRFTPSGTYVQTGLEALSTETFNRVATKAVAPPGTTSATIYLYTHRDPTPKVMVDSVSLVSGVEPPPPPPPPPPPLPPLPEPVPPVYDKLKDLHLTTALVNDGEPSATIVTPTSGVYDAPATRLQAVIEQLTGVQVPIARDDSPAAAVPIRGNLIVLGNRSTNKTIEELYNRYYCLLDLKYPGPEGYNVRSLHNPFGGGHNVILAGGSDDVGVAAAVDKLIDKLTSGGGGPGALSVGRLMEIRLGKGVQVPTDITQFETWEASKGYGSVGYFGWCSISKRMAMYYMTGDEHSAREFVRLAFPDAKAKQDIAEIDGERIENKDDPLAGFYHYNAHMAILYWDLIEESPLFSDEERLKITNAFSRQLNHRKNEGIYPLQRPARAVGSRHGQYSAISLYCLGRYFDKDYPSPVWAQCMTGAQHAFASLHEYAWVEGESDNLFWYTTGTAPVLSYMLLSGDRGPLASGALGTLLRAQEALLSGLVPDWALNSGALDYLNKAAYLMQDGRWITYRERTGVDTSLFRLGQSFWPEAHLQPALPTDLVGKWTLNRLSAPAWQARRNGFPPEQSFYFGSYRSAPDGAGDFALIDGFNGASRNPYHTLALLELRIAGATLLKGYRNQVLVRADGMVEPQIAMDAALLGSDVIGGTAVFVGDVPKAAYCDWRRSLVQRTGKYALVVDDLGFRTDSHNLEVQTLWEGPGSAWRAADNALQVRTAQPGTAPVVWEIRPADPVTALSAGPVTTLQWSGAARRGERRQFFSLIARRGSDTAPPTACVRLAPNVAALALPGAALAVVGERGVTKASLAVVAADHLFARGLESAGLAQPLVRADKPVDIDWDYAAGVLSLVAAAPTKLTLAAAPQGAITLDDTPVAVRVDEAGAATIELAAGRHVLTGLAPSLAVATELAAGLAQLVREGAAAAMAQLAAIRAQTPPTAPGLKAALVARIPGAVADMVTLPAAAGSLICAAEGKTVHVLGPDGREQRALQADGKVRTLHWWPEHRLLLVGCVDEQLIAFDEAGSRKWVFTSVMDPAVFRAAKTYWFKTAPGHEGIHGLATGPFIGGKTQAFVGSACTLEIVDENGQLVKRMPIFWGPGHRFALVAGPEGTTNLLVAREPTDSEALVIVNSKTLAEVGRGYNGVPPGQTYVGGWACMSRDHIFYQDIDGDGHKEVVSEVNGTWNRVTVWSQEGKPLSSATFGPGDAIPARNIRDLDLFDLNTDGKTELVTATSGGLVVALDHECRKLWAHSLASPPVVLKAMRAAAGGAPRVVVGCQDGSVVVLDGSGKLVNLDRVDGRPTHILALELPPTGPVVVIGTAKGEIRAFVP